jgi:hypothetical protein
MTAGEAKKLIEIVARIVDVYRGRPRISPKWVADEAMSVLDGALVVQKTFPLIWTAANLELRQLARSVLANRYMPESEEEGERDALFPALQWRYPTVRSKRSEDPEYVLRDLMTEEDVDFNIKRLESEAEAKLEHAKALRSWARSRRRDA